MRRSLLSLTIFTLLLYAEPLYAAEIKESDLAGSWYPASKIQLEKQLQGYLDAASPDKLEGDILALIVPHAGYIYSGPVAAYGYKLLEGKRIKTVIILGFSHGKYFNGMAIYDKGFWRTPLGDIQIDEALADEIKKNPRVKFNPDLFKEENSIEMQIPFIQMVLKDVKIVPIAFGMQDYTGAESLALTLAEIVSSPSAPRNDILIVASTDLSHYHSHDEANKIDRYTIGTLNKLKSKEFYDEGKLGICELCGLMPVTASLLVAEKLGYDRIKELKYADSGDITGDKSRVVGYYAGAVYKNNDVAQKVKSNMLNDIQRKRLLQIARESIISFVKYGKRKVFSEKDPLLNQSLGAFVTLHEKGELRGCIGNMVGQGPLYQTIADMAIEAATGDPRFHRLSPSEIDKIDIEISVLSPLQRVASADEIKVPGHGVIVRKGLRSGVYLPQVADETGWGKEEFLTSLCSHKAGLSPDAWKDPATELYTFTAEVFGEEGGKKDAQ
ncbi:MAG: AmmeMemoRadiSam system protein B [Candidatus Omnitrophota bacterium]|nr:AmmeMemoRadiSam system protein B [Candidatus Omnitrophota bacterium]